MQQWQWQQVFLAAASMCGLTCWPTLRLFTHSLLKVLPLFPYLHFKTQSPEAQQAASYCLESESQ